MLFKYYQLVQYIQKIVLSSSSCNHACTLRGPSRWVCQSKFLERHIYNASLADKSRDYEIHTDSHKHEYFPVFMFTKGLCFIDIQLIVSPPKKKKKNLTCQLEVLIILNLEPHESHFTVETNTLIIEINYHFSWCYIMIYYYKQSRTFEMNLFYSLYQINSTYYH